MEISKRLSSSAGPERSVLAGLEAALEARLLVPPFALTHGTTTATNALLERRGAKTALITTLGFRDLLWIARQNRAELYALHPSRPEPLLARDACVEVAERTDWNGETLLPLEESEVQACLESLQARGFVSLAVCFLFSYLAPRHEQRVRELAEAQGFQFVSLSSEVAPLPREYERASTTAANAFVAPILEGYLGRLKSGAETLGSEAVRIMGSNGGTLTSEEAGRFAARTALSGPAGGIVASLKTGEAAGLRDLICFDMGGTSADVALITNGECLTIQSGKINGLPLSVPQLDILTVGAGGGSILWRDGAGAFRVGPQSAGADPGPAAYGKGDFLTVTDAQVLLGRLPEEARLGGSLRLNRKRVQEKFAELALETGVSPEDAAVGVIEICNAAMTRAIRRISVKRGRFPADYWLLSYGGAGGLHACQLAEAVESRGVLIPPFPGAFSALGLALADTRREYLSVMPPELLPEADGPLPAHWLERLETLRERAAADFARDGLPPKQQEWLPSVELRYRGQASVQMISLRPTETTQSLTEAFHQTHELQFGYRIRRQRIEATTLKLVSIGRSLRPLPKPRLAETPARPWKTTTMYWKSWISVSLYHRHELAAQQTLTGGTIVLQQDATTLIPPGWKGTCDPHGNLVLEREGA